MRGGKGLRGDRYNLTVGMIRIVPVGQILVIALATLRSKQRFTQPEPP
jgi:hypothetical protein